MVIASNQLLSGVWVCALAAGAALVVAGCVQKPSAPLRKSTGAGPVRERDGAEPLEPVKKLANAAFYKADGSFDAAAAKKAYYDMMRAHGYPVPNVLRTDEFWVCDFLQGEYDKLGMAGIFWHNVKGKYGEAGTKAYAGDYKDASYGYLGHDIYLLPGQLLPEHRHVGGGEGYGPKMEAWHVRHGSVEFFGEYKGAGDETLISEMPANERPWGYGQDWFKSKYVARRSAGGRYRLDGTASARGRTERSSPSTRPITTTSGSASPA